MDDCEDVKKIDEIIRKHKIQAADSDELEYAEFIDYTDSNEADDINEIEDYEIPDFPKSDITKFRTYTPTLFLTDEEKKVIESCSDPDLKQLLILNRNKNIHLIQLYKKTKDLLEECQKNICMKEDFISASRNAKRVCIKIWRLGIPYFKTKDDFLCPRNEDIVRKHNNGELLFYDMTPSNKWLEKDMNRLFKGVAFHYKILRENELGNKIKQLEKEIAEYPDAEKEELVQEIKNDLEDIRNCEIDVYPPLSYDKHLNWNRISEIFLKDRYSAQDCEVFWNSYLHPEINKGPWTSEENEKLKNLASEYNLQNWDLIAAELGNNRTGFIACVHYFCKIDPPRQGRFTETEDKLLCDLVEKHKQGEYIPWTKIAHHFKDRTRGQLFYRYKYFLSCRNGKIKGKFTEAEDILILVLVDRFGKKFTKCGRYFPNRSVIQIKARYSSNLKGAIKKGSFTIEEDKEILKYVEKNGTSSWEPLGQQLNRCGGQMRQRYKTLITFLKAHPGIDLEAAPRRRFYGISFDTEYDFLRCMADKFKKCEKIPTLEDIEKLLRINPKPIADPLEPLTKEKSAHRELRPRRKKENIEKANGINQINSQNKKKPREYNKKSTEKKDNKESQKISSKEQNVSSVRAKIKSPPPRLESENLSDIDDDTFSEVNLSVDHLLVDFFSNSMKLNFEQNVNQQHVQRAAATMASVLRTLQAELHIPNDFDEDSRLDSIDMDILRILTKNRLVNKFNEYVINRESLYIDRLIPPNLNTVVGMRSLLIKNQIYKSKQEKRDLIFENFRTESKEKQVLWCINNHLSNQTQETQNILVSERNLFFNRFISLFKFPAIMTLQRPSDLLENSSKTWRDQFNMGVRTYKKKSRPTVTQKHRDNTTFESIFIKQQHQDDEYERSVNMAPPVNPSGSNINEMEMVSGRNHTESNLANTDDGELIKTKSCESVPKISVAEQLKRRINDTIEELNNSPPPKKFYVFEPIKVKDFSRRRASILNRKTYMPKTKNVPSSIIHTMCDNQSKNKTVILSREKATIRTETLPVTNPDNLEAHSSFNLSRGELILENDSPCGNANENNSISQDLLDLNVLNEALKKEKNVVEESFDF